MTVDSTNAAEVISHLLAWLDSRGCRVAHANVAPSSDGIVAKGTLVFESARILEFAVQQIWSFAARNADMDLAARILAMTDVIFPDGHREPVAPELRWGYEVATEEEHVPGGIMIRFRSTLSAPLRDLTRLNALIRATESEFS